jgi:hypothetical protein
VFAHLDVSHAAVHRLSPGVTWGAHVVPTLLELLLVLAIGVVLLLIGIAEFRHAE